MKEETKKGLSKQYAETNDFGTIILSSSGITIQGKNINSITKNDVSVENFGGKAIVTCSFVCDKFTLIP